MAYAKNQRTHIELSERQRVTYERRTALWGLIEWYVKVKADTIGKDIFILTDVEVDNVYLNGELIK